MHQHYFYRLDTGLDVQTVIVLRKIKFAVSLLCNVLS